MHTIIVEDICKCFKKSDLENNLRISDKDTALIKAMEMTTTMNEEFCNKHDFQLVENNNNFIISFKPEPSSGGCCGGGCGTH